MAIGSRFLKTCFLGTIGWHFFQNTSNNPSHGPHLNGSVPGRTDKKNGQVLAYRVKNGLTQFINLHEVQFDFRAAAKYFDDDLEFFLFFIYFLDVAHKLGKRTIYNFDGFTDEERFA